nr:MAG TPA: hypothetical protein [Caudoviricetes sp.]
MDHMNMLPYREMELFLKQKDMIGIFWYLQKIKNIK